MLFNAENQGKKLLAKMTNRELVQAYLDAREMRDAVEQAVVLIKKEIANRGLKVD